MGCFTVLRGKKKKPERSIRKYHSFKEKEPAPLPEPECHGPSLQSAPPSFRNRTKATQSSARASNSRTRALSAPSSLHMPDELDPLSSAEYEEQEESKSNVPGKDQRLPNPHPLPLPSSHSGSILRNTGSFKSSTASGPIFSGPLPLPPSGGLRNYSYDELASACQHFSADRCASEGFSSTVYWASLGNDSSGKKTDATVTCLLPSTQGYKDFVYEVNTVATLQHPQLCKLIGFHAREGLDQRMQRMLVYERLFHGSLDRLLFGRSEGPPIDWASRMKVALCAARGLAFLHEEGPFQAMYNEFSAANIQVDKDFSAKLSGYGCGSYNQEADFSNAAGAATLSPETLEKGILTPKSNVWSFGIVLLEILTGRKSIDSRFAKEEQNLVKWSKPYLTDDCRLSLIMDSRLKGRFPSKAARTVADIALKCLQREPSERPTMRAIMESLENIQDMKYSCRFPLQEPSAAAGKKMLKSPSLNGIVVHRAPRVSLSPPPSSRNRPSTSVSPPRASLPVPLPSRTCASTVSLEDIQMSGPIRKSTSTVRRPSVEGF